MPRPKKDGIEPKRRSRFGCWPCKSRKIKCGEEKPACLNCQKQGEVCDYSIRLNWDGRKRKPEDSLFMSSSNTPSSFTTGDSPSKASSPNPQHPPRSDPTAPTIQSSSSTLFPPSRTRRSPSFSNIPTPSRSEDTEGTSPASNSTYFRRGNTGSEEYNKSYDDSRTGPPTKRQRQSHLITPEDALEHTFDAGLVKYEPPSFSSNPLPPSPDSPQSRRLASYRHSTTESHDDDRRMSVRSLLDPELGEDNYQLYGHDQGRPDIDVPRNDDASALILYSPSSTLRSLNMAIGDEVHSPGKYGFGWQPTQSSTGQASYYDTAVLVQIPNALEPLPSILKDNPMNLLYFHHFLNHTATILVPHDCPVNPFRNILPQMALRCDNLMSLLLAYSASHRARFLKHPEPSTRIAQWTKDVFTNLRLALTKNDISDASLAAAIMLASLEIISPGAWGIDIPWQSHLALARSMMIARGGFRHIHNKSGHVSTFLGRWFQYLDILGSLSGSAYDRPSVNLSSSPSSSPGDVQDTEEADDTEIDCVLGITSRCILLLAQIADLAKTCDGLRRGADGVRDADWKPPKDIMDAADRLKNALEDARSKPPRICTHDTVPGWKMDLTVASEINAVNDCYHMAGRLHIDARILNTESDDPEIQGVVVELVRTLGKVRPNSAAEACLIMPLFTAGVEAKNQRHRDIILKRLESVEQSGMTQVHKARTLMQRVWQTGKAWENLVSGEFVG